MCGYDNRWGHGTEIGQHDVTRHQQLPGGTVTSRETRRARVNTALDKILKSIRDQMLGYWRKYGEENIFKLLCSLYAQWPSWEVWLRWRWWWDNVYSDGGKQFRCICESETWRVFLTFCCCLRNHCWDVASQIWWTSNQRQSLAGHRNRKYSSWEQKYYLSHTSSQYSVVWSRSER